MTNKELELIGQLMRKEEETVKTQWDIRKCFDQLRFDKDHHLGMGDIRLTIGMQEEICELVERFYRYPKDTPKMNTELEEFKAKVRVALSNYMRSEGCSCCRDVEDHKLHTDELGELLDVEKYPDGSGYDFSKYRINN